MSITGFVEGFIGGILGGSTVAPLIAGILKERWIEGVRHSYATQLEAVKSDLEKQQKTLQARVDRSVFVSKAQFDAEFNAMRDIYRFATETWMALEHTRPMFSYAPTHQTDEEKMICLQSRLTPLVVAFNKFSAELEILRPFYPQDLYSALLECRFAANKEMNQIIHGDECLGPQGYINADENREKFGVGYHRAAVLIRERLATLSIVGTSVG